MRCIDEVYNESTRSREQGGSHHEVYDGEEDGLYAAGQD